MKMTKRARGQKDKQRRRSESTIPILIILVALVTSAGVLWRVFGGTTVMVTTTPGIADIFLTSTPVSTPRPRATLSPTPTPTQVAKKIAPAPTPKPSLPTGNTQDDGCKYAQMVGISSPMDCNQFKESRGMDFVFGCGNCVVAGGDSNNTDNNRGSGDCCAGHGGISHCTALNYYMCNDGNTDPSCGCTYVSPTNIPDPVIPVPPPIGAPPPITMPTVVPIVVNPLPTPTTLPTPTPAPTPPHGWHVE